MVDYAPNAKFFAEASMDQFTLAKTKKFDISYIIAKEKLAFTKMNPIWELEESCGVNLGVGYKINNACATFVSFIAKKHIKKQFFFSSSQCQC